MKRCATLILLIISLVPTLDAQGLFGARQRPTHHFRGTQWYIGVTIGMSRSQASVMQSYSELSPIDPVSTSAKEYRGTTVPMGQSAGISATMAVSPFFQVVVSAKYANLKYGYQQVYAWFDPENEENYLLLRDAHRLSLGYVEIPVQLRYTFPINRLKPFAQAGIIYGSLVGARKELKSYSTDYASGSTLEIMRTQQTTDVSDSYITPLVSYGFGGGIIYNFGGLMVVAEANLQRGIHNITDAKNRFTATRHLAGAGHIPDDIKLNALTYSLSFQFPLKFLTNKDFKPVIF